MYGTSEAVNPCYVWFIFSGHSHSLLCMVHLNDTTRHSFHIAIPYYKELLVLVIAANKKMKILDHKFWIFQTHVFVIKCANTQITSLRFLRTQGTEAEIQLPLERSSRFQHLFPNPSWLVWGRASRQQKLAPIFPGIDSCLMVTKRDFSKWKRHYMTKREVPKCC